MLLSSRWCIALAWFLLVGGIGNNLEAQTPGSAQPDTSAHQDPSSGDSKSSPTDSLESLKLPAGAIFVSDKELGGISGVMFPKEGYEALRKRLEQLERLLQPGKPQPPSSCKIRGQIEGDRAHFQI